MFIYEHLKNYHAFLIDSKLEISLNCVTSTTTNIALSALKLLLARRYPFVDHVSSGFNVTTLFSSFATVGDDLSVKVARQSFS